MGHARARGLVALLTLSLLCEALPPAAVAPDSVWPPATAASSDLAESDGTTYLYGLDLLAIDRSGTTSWYLPDGLGSTRKVTDAAGSIVAGYAYEAFGRLRSATGSLSNDVRFTGERTDPEVGLLFLRARHYDPDTGRFLQADKWPYDERNSQDLHRYAYVRNDPLNAVDPSGHIAFLAVAFAALTVVDVVTSFAELARDPNPGTAAMAAVSLMPGSWFLKAGSWAVKGARAAVAGIKAGIQIARGTRLVERTTRAVSGAAGWAGARVGDAREALSGLFNRAPGAQKPASAPPPPGQRLNGSTGSKPTATGAVRFPDDPGQIKHIFRDAPGHLADSPANRKLLQSVADDASTTLGTDKFGNVWSARTLDDGTQAWVQTRNGVIQNGGLNQTPRVFNPDTGLSGP